MDARQARDGNELRTEDLVPESLDNTNLGEEAMPPDIEAGPSGISVGEPGQDRGIWQ